MKNKSEYDATYRKNHRKETAARMAVWRKMHYKRLLAYAKAYYKAHRKENSDYYKAHRKEIAARGAAYNKSHRKERAAYRKAHRKEMAAYRKEHRQKIAAQTAVYRKTIAPRHAILINRHKKQLSPRGIKGSPMTLAEHQMKLFYKDGRERRCFYCGCENNKTGTGLDRLNNTFTYTFKNTVPCCWGCNSWRAHRSTVQETLNHFKPMRDAARFVRKKK